MQKKEKQDSAMIYLNAQVELRSVANIAGMVEMNQSIESPGDDTSIKTRAVLQADGLVYSRVVVR